MIKVYFILILFLLPINAWASACNNVVFAPEVVFSSSYGKLKYDVAKSKEFITNLSIKHGKEKNFVAGGLAIATLEMRLNVSSDILYQKTTDVCVIPKKIEVFIGFQNPTIYVANHLKEGECRFYITLRHEQAHMQINKKTLEYYLPQFKRAIENFSLSIGPLNIDNLADASNVNDYYTELYANKIRDLIEKFNNILQNEHMRLDSKENYDYESTLCK